MTDFPVAPQPCPERGAIPPMHAAELTLDAPSHKHVRVGGLEFCFRENDRGWMLNGCTTTGAGHVFSPATMRESFQVAREAIERIARGAAPVVAPAVCPECEQRFAAGPGGTAPHEWHCGPTHHAVSAEGTVTRYAPGEPPEVIADDPSLSP